MKRISITGMSPKAAWVSRSARSPATAALVLALIVMGPLLLPGRILTLDSPLAINWDTTGFLWGTSEGLTGVDSPTYGSAPVAFILKALGAIVSVAVAEKLWLGFLIWAAAFGASRLPGLSGPSRYYSGALYALNPFSYIRFVSGQWGVLGAYALTPFLVSSFIRVIDGGRRRDVILTGALFALITSLQIHAALISILILSALFAGRLFTSPGKAVAALGRVLLSGLVALGFSSFWILRLFDQGSAVINNMPIEEMIHFAARTPFDVVTLRGFWAAGSFLDVADVLPIWLPIALAILWLAVYGFVRTLEDSTHRWIGLGLGLAALVGLILAIGPTISVTRWIFEWAWENAVWYRAFRDSHKFVAIIALGYAYLGAMGIASLSEVIRRRSGWSVQWARRGQFLLLVLPIVYGIPMYGTMGQVKPTVFPNDWHEVRKILEGDRSDHSVLFLPWHKYSTLDWLPNRNKSIAVPIQMFFSTQNVISGDNWEIPPSYSDSNNAVSRYVEHFIASSDGSFTIAGLLAPLNSKYVAVLKSADFERYRHFWSDEGIELVHEGPTIVLFRTVRTPTRAYIAEQLVPIAGLASVDNLAVTGTDLSFAAFVLDADQDGTPEIPRSLAPTVNLETEQLNPATFRITVRGEAGTGPLVFTIPQRIRRTNWRLDGAAPIGMNLGMMPIFQLSDGAGQYELSRGHSSGVLLAGYLVTIFTFMATAIAWTGSRKQARVLRVLEP